MSRPQIVRLYGHADLFDIEFTHAAGDTWTCEVPPDTADGVYAVELWAVNELGFTAYWTGELYMTNGVCHLVIHKPRYQIRIKQPDRCICVKQPKHFIRIKPRCTHGYAY